MFLNYLYQNLQLQYIGFILRKNAVGEKKILKDVLDFLKIKGYNDVKNA